MATTTKSKGQQIVDRLNDVKIGLATISELLTSTLQTLEEAQSSLLDTSKYIPKSTVDSDYMPRSTVNTEYTLTSDIAKKYTTNEEAAKKVEEAKSLLETCQSEIDAIDEATSGVEASIEPLLEKAKAGNKK